MSNTATARVLHPVEVRAPEPAPPPAPAASPARPPYQRPLFNSREVPQVVPFESIAPKPVEKTRRRTEPSKPRPKRPIPGQQALEFSAPIQTIDTEVQAVIYCDAPVAIPAHRMMATAADWSLIGIAVGMFAWIFILLGGEVVVTKQTIPLLVGIVAVLGLLYRVLWCLADADSPGMRWAHLRLVDFDGRKPGRRQRLSRAAAASLSLMAAGLGVMWAALDEESLTWHDHISKSFPTPY